MNKRIRSRSWLVAALTLLMLTLPQGLIAAPPSGGGGGKISVTAANPPEAFQGVELDVIVTGSGFEAGSSVSYLVTGTTDASQVEVLWVQFISSTQLKTRVRPKDAALPTQYDIEVRTLSGRKGKGTTLFKVTDPSVILPVSLGVPTGCSNSLGTGLNDGAYPAALVVTADTYSCTSGKDRPYRWQNGAWYNLGTLGSATSGITMGVSNDGKIVGWVTSSTGINTAFVVSGGTMTALPLLAGMVHAEAHGISQKDGTHIFGTSSIEGETNAVRWARDMGGAWNGELIGVREANVVPEARGSSDDGSIVVGQQFYTSGHEDPSLWNKREGWVWMAGALPEWNSLGLGSEANDISPRGELIVGVRYQDNGEGTNTTYQVPVYWTANDGFSMSHDLMGLDDGAGSKAEGVGMLQNGKLVIVGFAHTFGSSQNRTMRAVAWLPVSPGEYGPPIRLSAIGGSSTLDARAVDVNANGMVVGYSNATGGSRRAVLWQLPVTP